MVVCPKKNLIFFRTEYFPYFIGKKTKNSLGWVIFFLSVFILVLIYLHYEFADYVNFQHFYFN